MKLRMNILLSETIAKKRDQDDIFQTFEGHTFDAFLILKDYMIKNQGTLRCFSGNFNLEYDTLCNLLFLTIYLHDIGKLTEEFQRKIKNSKSTGEVSHAFFGLPFVNSNLPEDLNIIMRLVVLSHHSQLYNQIYQDANLSTKVTYIQKLINEYIEKAIEVYNQEFRSIFQMQYFPQYKIPNYLNNSELNENIKEKEIAYLKYKQEKKLKSERTKAIYALTLSVLKYCDQKASKNFGEINLNGKKIFGSLLSFRDAQKFNYSQNVFIVDRNRLFANPFDYQKEVLKIDYNGIIFAPCGRGKTEAALNTSLNIIKKYHKNKIIFALPTQITSNMMFKRMQEIFGEENVGIYHGLSRFLHEMEKDEAKDEEIETLIRDEKVFAKPVTVTTIDHLIYSLIHGYKQADYAFGNILNSVVVFDEIHYYEKDTLRYIIDVIKIFNQLKIAHIAMSGTFPDFLKDRLNKIGDYTEIRDEKGLAFSPFLIECKNSKLFDNISEIFNLYHKGKTQIIIVNTVKRAQSLYKEIAKLIKENIILYHSVFTHYDRAYSKESKENNILSLNKLKEPWIIISTQALEISVDISCDIMHTELAPVDALGQRGGRLNRGGKTHNNCYILYIYTPDDHKPYYFGKEGEEDFVEKTKKVIKNGEITYKKIKQWCDEVYQNTELLSTELENVFQDCILFGFHPNEIRYSEEQGNRIQIRKDNFVKVDVIPEEYWEKYDLKNKSNRINKFEVKIPYFWCKKYNDQFYLAEDEYNNKHMITVIPYTAEYGFDLDKISEADVGCLMF